MNKYTNIQEQYVYPHCIAFSRERFNLLFIRIVIQIKLDVLILALKMFSVSAISQKLFVIDLCSTTVCDNMFKYYMIHRNMYTASSGAVLANIRRSQTDCLILL